MSPADRSGSANPGAAKGIVVIVAAVAIGVVLLARGGSGGIVETGARSSTSTVAGQTTLAGSNAAPTTATPLTNAPANVKVAVFNATGGKSSTAAGQNRDKLTPLGYANILIGDTSASATSAIYYIAGSQGDAEAVRKTLGLPVKQVQPTTAAASLPGGVQGYQVIVIVGQDAVGGSTATTSKPN